MVNQITLVIEIDDAYTLKDVLNKLDEPINEFNGTVTQAGIYRKKSTTKTSG